MVSALAILASDEEWLISGRVVEKDIPAFTGPLSQLYEGVRPPLFHWLQKYGIYVFKFYKLGQPIYVMVDNRIPVYKDSFDVCFGRCEDLRELWFPLIEKAYAKLHGSYSSLASGDISQGLRDLANFVPNKYKIESKKLRKKEEKDQFWRMLTDLLDSGSLIGCNIDGGT